MRIAQAAAVVAVLLLVLAGCVASQRETHDPDHHSKDPHPHHHHTPDPTKHDHTDTPMPTNNDHTETSRPTDPHTTDVHHDDRHHRHSGSRPLQADEMGLVVGAGIGVLATIGLAIVLERSQLLHPSNVTSPSDAAINWDMDPDDDANFVTPPAATVQR
jgi:hypothetical protein